MGNHVHLLMKIGIEPLEQVMRRLCGSYVYWYNNKYQRIGNLKNAIDLQQLDCQTRNTYLRMLKQKYNLSIRQIERLTGINRGIVLKA